jgi:DNA-binding XRE family transcriptional regulator
MRTAELMFCAKMQNMPSRGRLKPADDQDLQERADWAVAVRHRRRTLRLTQRDVAGLAGVAERTVIAVEAGSTGVRLESLVAVLSVLGLGMRIERGRGIVAGDT